VKYLSQIFVLLFCLSVFGACGRDSADSADAAKQSAAAPADLVLRGGKVATVDPALGNTQAIAVTGY
jgi:hypothetical protein